MAKKTEAKASNKIYEMVSFRIAIEHFRVLEAYAQSERDPESGTPLTPSLAARSLLVKALGQLPKKKP